MADKHENSSPGPATNLLEILVWNGPWPNPWPIPRTYPVSDNDSRTIRTNKCAWEAFLRHADSEIGLSQFFAGLFAVESVPGLARAAAARLSFYNDNMSPMSPRLKIQSTRAASAFVTMVPSLHSLSQLVDLVPSFHTTEEIANIFRYYREPTHRSLATLASTSKTLWALLYSVFEAYDDGSSTIEIVHLCRFINNVGIKATYLQMCVNVDQLLPNLPTRIAMGLCHLCVDLISLHQGDLAIEATPASADPPTFTGLLRAFQEDLDSMAQYGERVSALYR
ncbi:hypothetical protein RB595_001996 [Gaeumannomyces hyphopodioides]